MKSELESGGALPLAVATMFGNHPMKTRSKLVAGGGWRGTRLDRIKVKAWLALFLAMVCGGVSILSIGSVLFYACIPAVGSLTVAVVLFIRERPIEIDSLSGRVGADPRKLYGSFGGCDVATHKRNAEQDADGRPPTRSEPNLEGNEKPQLKSEGRSR